RPEPTQPAGSRPAGLPYVRSLACPGRAISARTRALGSLGRDTPENIFDAVGFCASRLACASFSGQFGCPMAYVVAVLIALFGGWWVAATDALFRASERPGMFAGTPGMVLLLIGAAGGGLLLAGCAIWIAQLVSSASAALVIGLFGFL